MRRFSLAVLVALAAVACDKQPASAVAPGLDAVRVPTDAWIFVSSPTLDALLAPAQRFGDLPVESGEDAGEPAWIFCQDELCAMHRGRDLEELERDGNVWRVPDASGSIDIWGSGDRSVIEAALNRWRSTGTEAADPPANGLRGWVDPDPTLRRWQPKQPRSKELIERVVHQSGRIAFDLTTEDDRVRIALRMKPTPGEPRFIDSLGAASGTLPRVGGLIDRGILGAVRLSADPSQLWTLLRSTFTADQRAQIDAFLGELSAKAGIHLPELVIDAVDGHILLVLYGLSDRKVEGLSDWMRLRATREAVFIPIRQRDTIRRALDAGTQMSGGDLRVQRATGERLEWAWLVDGELSWTVVLGQDYLVFLDSSVSLEHFRTWRTTRPELPDSLVRRGVDDLVAPENRSGIYVDLGAVRSMVGEPVAGIAPDFQAATIVAREQDGQEVIDITLTTTTKP